MKSSSRPVTTALAALPWVLVVALTALNLLHMSRLGPNDDAYITFRVARNLAAGHGPVFNPGEQVLSVTTPGYMLLLAAASVVSRDFVRLGLALNGVALLLVGALVIDLSHIVNPTGPETSPDKAALCAFGHGSRQPYVDLSPPHRSDRHGDAAVHGRDPGDIRRLPSRAAASKR